ncbi:DUF6665 family protein [Alsobacter sp. R-9]
MSLRPPQSLMPGGTRATGASVLEVEIAQQRAETLGDLGAQLEAALAALRDFDANAGEAAGGATAGGPGGGKASGAGADVAAQRDRLLDKAADRAWALMIQRELSGLRHWEQAVRAYGIPREVLNRMGRIPERGTKGG